MVVAEVPLWVLHSNNASEAVGTAAAAEPADEDKGIHRAKKSMALLENAGKSRKCAIYSIDVHGNRFATAGGDGCVRIWSVSALFAPKQKGGKFSEDGAYVSTSASSAAEEESEEDISVANMSTSNGNGAKEDAFEDQVEVHDLNSFVRRKKDGSPSPSKKNKTTAFSAPSPVLQSTGASRFSAPGQHAKDKQHRLLCTLSAHTGSSVLAVRFSTSGKFLASAGDDSCVCIYAPSSQAAATGNLVEKAGPENWSRIKLCRGHGLDVVGLAWAPDDSHLVSCSLDSETPIIVWKLSDLNGNSTTNCIARGRGQTSMICNPFRVLGKGVHTSTVKGVAFDPAGSYLASSGDDPAVCIWRAHDDWGLEKRVDSSTGIFRRWNQDDAPALSNQSLFRRLSWSTDGAFVCSTNSVVKNKHVASTISREGWSVSSAQSAAAGAANLVGHKQPVVVSRHASQLLDARKKEDGDYDDDDDEEPEYATLLALGDKRGFVTIWSTKKSRPLFKLQCSESRCTVTDLAWGTVANGDLMLLVSLLDGQVVALRFGVPDELGALLSKRQQARVFQLRYGIDIDDIGGANHGRLFVGGNSGPKLIENALQMSLENRNEEDDNEGNDNMDTDPFSQANDEPINQLSPRKIQKQQKESKSKGKKRVRPVLMIVGASGDTRPKHTEPSTAAAPEQRKSADPLQNAMDAAQKASTLAETAALEKRDGVTREPSTGDRTLSDDGNVPPSPAKQSRLAHTHSVAVPASAPISHSMDRIQTVELPPIESSSLDLISEEQSTQTAECTNASKIPPGSKGGPIPCIDISISHKGRVSWKDQIPGTSCSAVAASRTVLAVGAADGSVQLFGSSPTLGWACGNAFRSHPPFVLGHPIVALQLDEKESDDESTQPANVMMLAVTADGTFGVYRILPELRLEYKGSLMPAMTHMSLTSFVLGKHRLPKLSRVQVTESGRLLLLLSLMHPAARNDAVEHTPRGSARSTAPVDGGVGGSLQAFVYDRPSELWMRISDSRFVLSDFYSSLPSARSKSQGVLARMDDAVRLGSLESSIKASHRGRSLGSDHADGIYNQAEDDSGNYLATRSHCEDRMACAMALGSASEFSYWLSMYARTLSVGGRGPLLRMLVDMLFGTKYTVSTDSGMPGGASVCWWLSSAPQVLGLDRKKLVKTIVVPEMSKNRALQRITNEIALEVDS